MVSNLFNQVTTETSSCASAFWDLLFKTFPPSSPQVVAGLIALLGLVVLVPSVAPIPRVLDAASALFTANSLMGRSVSCVPGRLMRQPMSVRLPLLLPRPSLVMRFGF